MQGQLKALAGRFPLRFATAFFAISTCLVLLDTFVLPFGLANGALQAALAFAVMLWLGWTRTAGFNGPSSWRDFHLLWLPAVVTLISMSALALVRASNLGVLLGAGTLTLITGINEEARFRGVILQALLPYGWRRAALLSALFFSASHLVNLFAASPLVVIPQLIATFLMGLGYAACRLRTNTIWPLIVFHACNDLSIDINTLNGGGITLAPTVGIGLFASSLLLMLVLGGYGLYLLRGRHSAPAKRESL